MFDYLISLFLFGGDRQKEVRRKINYKILELGPRDTDEITLIFTHWHSTEAAAKRIYRKLGKGKRAIVIKMNNALSSDPDDVLKEHLSLRASVNTLIAANNLKVVRIIGVSIGNIHVGYFADNCNPRYVDMVAPGESLAGCLWSGYRTSGYRREYSKLNLNEAILEDRWQEFSYKKYHEFLKREECSVRIWISSADKLIRPEEFTKLKALIPKRKGIVIKRNRLLGHYLTLLKVWYFWKPNFVV
jgi:hypothetical protein